MDTNKTANSTTSKDDGTEKMARAAIEEARMVTPGIQALFGFQLVAAFNERFRQLGPIEQALHFMALVLVALSVALIMTPAAYHRIAEPGSVSRFFVRLASWFIAIAMVPLMTAVCLDVYNGSAVPPLAFLSLFLARYGLHFRWPDAKTARAVNPCQIPATSKPSVPATNCE